MLSLLVTLAITGAELIYLRGWYRLRNAIPHLLSVWRLAAFSCGLLALWAAIASPLAELDHHLLTAHMAQHILLMTVSAPLTLLSAPVIVLLNGLPKPFARLVSGPLCLWSPMRTLGHLAANPVFCWFAGTGTVIAWHILSLFQAGMRSAQW